MKGDNLYEIFTKIRKSVNASSSMLANLWYFNGNQIGFFLVKAGGALIDNMALLFVIGVGVGMAEKHDGTGGLAALASWLMITNLLSTAVVTTIMPSIAKNADATLAFDKISNPFIGILAGVIGSMCYNKFKDTKLPDWLSFFSGKRCVAIIAGVVSIIVSVVLLFVWPVVFTALITVGLLPRWELLELVFMHS